jgi:uncharacterized protein (UPF0333 family)
MEAKDYMDKKGQGALEYLLLIGGAVLVASIVIALITGTTAGQKDTRAQVKCAVLSTCDKCISTVAVTGDNGCTAKFSDGTIKNLPSPACTTAQNAKFQYCDTNKTI